MKRSLTLAAAAALWLAAHGTALAQSACPYIATGAVLTAAQWNGCFQAKQDALGYTAVNKAGDVMLGKLTLSPSSSAGSGANVTPGIAPSAPNNGDLWVTSLGFFVRINGVTYQLATSPLSGALNVTVANAFALSAGPNGVTNPAFNVDTSVASMATGLNVQGKAAGSGVAVKAISSGLNESLNIDAKGTGKVIVGATSTGGVQLPNLGTGTCSNGVARDSGNNVITVVCPGTSLQIGAALSGATANTLLGSGSVSSGNGTVASVTPDASITVTPTTIKQSLANATLQANPTNPAGTTSTTFVQMGLGTTCKITPVYSSRVMVSFYGSVTNTVGGNRTDVEITWGTGTAPANGAAVTGTALGNTISNHASGAGNLNTLADGGAITGLTPGTAIWLDLAVKVSTGTGTTSQLSCTAIEY